MKKSVRTQENYHSNHVTNITPNRQRRIASTTTSPIKFNCGNHQSKLATHRLYSQQSQQVMYYCEKCSIMLASQGFNVIRIANQGSTASLPSVTPQRGRLSQIQSFLSSLQQHLMIMSVKYTQTQQQLMQSQQWYSSLTEKIKSYFSNLHQILQIQKYISYNSLLSKRASNQSELRLLRQNLKQSIIQIKGMMDDIQNNLDAVQGVQYSVYASIMAGYQQKLAGVPTLINKECKLPIKYNIIIPQVPNMLYSLADKISLRNPQKSTRPSYQQMSRVSSRRSPLNPIKQILKFQQKMNHSQKIKQNYFDDNKHLKLQKNSQVSLGLYFQTDKITESEQQKCDQTQTLLIA